MRAPVPCLSCACSALCWPCAGPRAVCRGCPVLVLSEHPASKHRQLAYLAIHAPAGLSNTRPGSHSHFPHQAHSLQACPQAKMDSAKLRAPQAWRGTRSMRTPPAQLSPEHCAATRATRSGTHVHKCTAQAAHAQAEGFWACAQTLVYTQEHDPLQGTHSPERECR